MDNSQTKLMYIYTSRLICSRNQWIPGTEQPDNAIELLAGDARLTRTRQNFVRFFLPEDFVNDLKSFMSQYFTAMINEALNISDPDKWTANFINLCRLIQSNSLTSEKAEITLNISLEDLDEMNLVAYQAEKYSKMTRWFSYTLEKANRIAEQHLTCLYPSKNFAKTIVSTSLQPGALNPWLGNTLRLFHDIVYEQKGYQM